MTNKSTEDKRRKIIEGVKAHSQKYGFPTKKKDTPKKEKKTKADS